MFETVVGSTAGRRRGLFYSTLPLSVTAHLLAGTALLASAVWSVEFPTQSPKIGVAFRVSELLPPPPPPPPPPSPAAQTSDVKSLTPPPIVTAMLAPTIIPEQIPEVLNEPVITADQDTTAGVEGGVEGGIAGGIIGGVVGGVVGGVLGGEIGGVGSSDPAVVEFPRDAILPLDVIWKPYPDYPLRAQLKGIEDQLVVRYVIGKNGRVKSVTVIEPPKREEFAKATITRLKEWRFRPFVDERGNHKEVAHELLVRFRIVHSGV